MEDKRIIEINGIKMEVDLRHARAVESYKVGDKVKVLVKSYSDSYYSYPGMIVGFDAFEVRPTIIVAYLKADGYESDPLKFVYINQDTKETEITPVVDDFIALEKGKVVDLLDRAIAKKEDEISDLKAKKEYFLKYFNAYFENK